MSEASYRNFGHYLRDGWAKEPKQSFIALAKYIAEGDARGPAGQPAGRLLDVGCATGELIGYLAGQFPALRFTGVDVFEELLQSGRGNLPGVEFVRASALELPAALHGTFDFVTAVGVASVFDETQIEAFWRNLLGAARPGGLVIALSPLNEFGVDTMIRHRKRAGGKPLPWETGWNVFAIETIREIVHSLGGSLRTERFRYQGRLEPRADPVRTWTLPTGKDPQQLTNGLKLLVDHYFMIVRKGAPQRGAEND